MPEVFIVHFFNELLVDLALLVDKLDCWIVRGYPLAMEHG